MSETRPQSPPVVAVIVAHQPGDWFEECLAALTVQDHPNVHVLVLDAGNDAGLEARVNAVVPDSIVRAAGSTTFAETANAALRLVSGSGFLCLMHDDVALEPTAIRLLVEEAYRSNAGVVAPKLVDWDHPDQLVDVGYSIDKFGETYSPIVVGELDQEQHDAVVDRFYVSSACLLVRSDLLRTLEGYDSLMVGPNDDLDLCWRAHLAGARVLVAPGAVGRHGAGFGRVDIDRDRRTERNRLARGLR